MSRALDALSATPAELRLNLASPFLEHPLFALRIVAARQLAPFRGEFPQGRRAALDAAIDEYRESQSFNSDRAAGNLNLAALARDLGDFETAEAALLRAIEREGYQVAAYVSLAELYRSVGRNSEALSLLQKAIASNPEDPVGHLSLGLAEVRLGQTVAALERFETAVGLAPDDPYYHYVNGIALDAVDTNSAIAFLTSANERFPGYRDITFALATMHRDAGRLEQALGYARDLLALSPDDASAGRLVSELEAQRR